jgi:hypothetical protein
MATMPYQEAIRDISLYSFHNHQVGLKDHEAPVGTAQFVHELYVWKLWT